MNSNMYEVNATDVLEAYGEFVDGTPEASALVLSARPLPTRAADALKASFASFSYGPEAVAWAMLENPSSAFRGATLGAAETMNLVEGLDPLMLVAADEAAAAVLATAYHRDIPLDETTRLLGRPIAAFRDFSSMLDDADAKQIAWALLKKLF